MRLVVAPLLHRCSLHPHPSCLDPVLESAAVELRGNSGATVLDARLATRPGRLSLPEGQLDPLRLWEHTCLELFTVRANEPGYVEWNFSPTGQVTRFVFSAYRERAHTSFPDLVSVRVERAGETVRMVVEGDLGVDQMKAGAVTVVARDTSGSVAFWAAAHPRPQPDFHDSAGFVLTRTPPR